MQQGLKKKKNSQTNDNINNNIKVTQLVKVEGLAIIIDLV